MAVWFAIPTKKDPVGVAEAVAPWRGKGYKIALFRDACDAPCEADLIVSGQYRGYPKAANELCHAVFREDAEADLLCVAGDDMHPPHLEADQIADECTAHFGGTFGVMQCTGDRRGFDHSGRAAAERICGSPFLGRDFCRRWNGGIGPFWPDYFHYYADEELHDVSMAAGILWQRQDLTIRHDHPIWTGKPNPDYMQKALKGWRNDEEIFKERKAFFFPCHEPMVEEMAAAR